MLWRIEFRPSAKKSLTKLGHTAQNAIEIYLDKLVRISDPRDLGKLLRHDKKGIWRYRVDKYRILCRIEDDRLVILVIEIGKRDSIYG